MTNLTENDGFSYSFVKNNRFKTTLISIGFYSPLDNNSAANALACALMKSGTEKLPDTYSFNRHLAHLYGAGVSSSAIKAGDLQELRISITVNDDRYSLNSEKTVAAAGDLLCDMVFSRFLSKTDYPHEAVLREKRLLCEKINSKINDKRIFARNRCEEIMCNNEPYGISPDGTIESVTKLNIHDVTNAVERLIRTSFISVLVIGSQEPIEFIEKFTKYLDLSDRHYSPLPTDITLPARTTKKVEEFLPVKQGKLVLGLRSQEAGSDRDTVAEFIMTDIFGGGPYSKLFCNVREKMSLCYYCSARGVRRKGLIFVESGVEDKNIDAAEKEILNQFNYMTQGAFSENDIAASKLSLCDMLRSIESDQPSLARWYTSRALEKNPASPKEYIELIEKITANDIKNAAQKFKPDTIYALRPDNTAKEEA